MSISVRAGRSADFDAIMDLLNVAFHNGTPDEQAREAERGIFEPERSLVAWDGEQVVGHVGAFQRELTVPGGVVPAAFITMVGVAHTHRRRGIASELLRQQLRDVRSWGEPVAVLWASEGRIYPRYGYGLASMRMSLKVDTREVSLRHPAVDPGTLRVGPPADLLSEMKEVYDAVRPTRPGFADRTPQWWQHIIVDPPSRRDGATELRTLLHEGPDGVDGFALYRIKGDWNDAGPNGAVQVSQLIAASPTAYRAMWGFLLDLDLTRSVTQWMAAVDEPLLYLVNEVRRVGAAIGDGLWARVTDVAAALSVRRYAAPIDLVLEVTDTVLPENAGRYRLRGDREKAECSPTTDPADLTMDITTLGALYLGGNSAGALAAGGLITAASPAALASADAALRWDRAPQGAEMF
jgi:predicted acetyltransferase